MSFSILVAVGVQMYISLGCILLFFTPLHRWRGTADAAWLIWIYQVLGRLDMIHIFICILFMMAG